MIIKLWNFSNSFKILMTNQILIIIFLVITKSVENILENITKNSDIFFINNLLMYNKNKFKIHVIFQTKK